MKDIPREHLHDDTIFQYVYVGGANPEQVILKGLQPAEFTQIPFYHENEDNLNYEYRNKQNITECYGKTYYPDEYTNIPQGHVRDDEKFEYHEQATHEEYKAKKEGDQPADWTNVPAQHVRDEQTYEYHVIVDMTAQYKGRVIRPQAWTEIGVAGVEITSPHHIFRQRVIGEYKGKRIKDNLESFNNEFDHPQQSKDYGEALKILSHWF